MFTGVRGAIRIAVGMFGLVLIGAGCPADDGSGSTEGETETEGADETATGGMTTLTTADTGSSDDGLDTTTGGPMSDALTPCDPRDDEPCDVGVCAGSGAAGYYCRPGCSAMAEPGDPCGADDVCLSDGWSDQLACFDIDGCDFLTGDPCGPGLTCAVVSFEPVRTQCVPSPGGALGMLCGPAGALECDPGAGCLGTDLDGDDPGACQAWCVPDGTLPAGCSQCIALNDEIGTCAECSVLAQDCPDGQGCQLINEALGGACVDHGPGGPGDACNPFEPGQSCEEGGLCIETEVDDVFQCVATCDPGSPMCPDATSCVDLGAIVPGAQTGQLGICIETGTVFCDPDMDPTGCAGDDVCLAIDAGVGVCGAACDPTTGDAACAGNTACIPATEDNAFNLEPFAEGNGACGVGCSDDAECGGGTCLLLDGVDIDGVCGVTCTPPMGAECQGGETCVPTPGDPGVGACIPGGQTCDEMMVGGCPTAAACVDLDGGASAICMTPCFEHNPNACGGMAELCHVKTEPRWHGGVCIGGGPACDPITQDCPGGDNCNIIGGQAIGGVAYQCEEPGAVAENGDCSMADCAAGLTCFDDVCRVYCDPGNDDCAAGTCTDISGFLYLPAATLGVCM